MPPAWYSFIRESTIGSGCRTPKRARASRHSRISRCCLLHVAADGSLIPRYTFASLASSARYACAWGLPDVVADLAEELLLGDVFPRREPLVQDEAVDVDVGGRAAEQLEDPVVRVPRDVHVLVVGLDVGQQVVPHQVGDRQILAARVQGLEDDVGVVLVVHLDPDELQPENLLADLLEPFAGLL